MGYAPGLTLSPARKSEVTSLGSFTSIPGRSYRLLVSENLSAWTDYGLVRAADWPATSTSFELDPGTAVPGKLFVKVTTATD